MINKANIIYLLPLTVFAALVFVFAFYLLRPAQTQTISKPLPPLSGLNAENLKGQISLINFFASWCTPCRAEHENLMTLAQKHNIPVYGVAYKDDKKDTEKYLRKLGSPYKKIIYDEPGRAFINWGLSGVPETFVIGTGGKIRYHHAGVMLEEDVRQTILPLIKTLEGK